jgi:tetratricopeptide (TPR) repeat protein
VPLRKILLRLDPRSLVSATLTRTVRQVALTLCLVFLFSGLARWNSPLAAQESSPHVVGLRIIVMESSDEADQVLKRLNQGEDFAAIAAKESIDPTSTDGGYMGQIDPSTLRAELRDALQGVGPGKTTAIVHLPSGYAILKVMEGSEHANTPAAAAGRILPLAATGTIHYSPNVGGKGEADLAFRTMPKPENWSQDLQGLCKIRQQSLAMVIDDLNKQLAADNSGAAEASNPLSIIETRFALANLYAYKGEMEKSVEQWETAYALATEKLPSAMSQLEEVLAIAYLHKSEMDNDVYRKPGARCLFPPPAGMCYQKPEASEKSIQYALKFLAQHPDALDIKWTLNLGYMTLGKYPDGVPKEYLIPPSIFDSPESVGRFVDVAPEAGINLYSLSGGLIVDDFENNGLLDIVTSDYDQCAPMHYFHNNGDGTFSDRTAQAGLDKQLGGLNMIQADYNNDGCMDILVLRGAWEFPQRKSLLRNNCNGTFTDVTVAAGLAEPATRTQTAVWLDLDNDGYLDLFVGNENGPSQLFRNQRNGTFKDISHTADVDRIAFTKGVAAADYDNDGYIDSIRLQPQREPLPLSQQSRRHVQGSGPRGRSAKALAKLRGLVFRLR